MLRPPPMPSSALIHFVRWVQHPEPPAVVGRAVQRARVTIHQGEMGVLLECRYGLPRGGADRAPRNGGGEAPRGDAAELRLALSGGPRSVAGP